MKQHCTPKALFPRLTVLSMACLFALTAAHADDEEGVGSLSVEAELAQANAAIAGMRQFQSMEDYEEFVALYAHQSESKTVTQAELSPELVADDSNADMKAFLATLLDDENMMSVGEWVLKVDLDNALVGVLHKNSTAYIDDLKDNHYFSEHTFWLSTNDDVLDIIDSKDLANAAIDPAAIEDGSYLDTYGNNFEKELEGIGAKDVRCSFGPVIEGPFSENFPYNTINLQVFGRVPDNRIAKAIYDYENPDDIFNYKIKHVYQRAGVAFSITSEVKQTNTFPGDTPMMSLDMGWCYERRKRFGRNVKRSGRDVRSLTAAQKLNIRPYFGTRGLRNGAIYSNFCFEFDTRAFGGASGGTGLVCGALPRVQW